MSEKLTAIYVPMPLNALGDGPADPDETVRVEHQVWDAETNETMFTARDETTARAMIAAWNRRAPAPEGEVVAWMDRDVAWDVISDVHKKRWSENNGPKGTQRYSRPLYASPVVPVGARERVLDELDKAWLHGQRRTSWRRDESADATLAALRPTDTGWRDIATAPKDGTDVLVCDDETGERHVSYWTGDCWSGRNRFKPTHWMPLHPAPTDTGRE
jgi:hypothetical protein